MEGKQSYVDFSGVTVKTDNPYDALIEECNDDPVLIQERYETHRERRNAQQKSRLLDPSFSAVDIDPILFKLVNKRDYPTFQDPRHCLVFWARPPLTIRHLIQTIQSQLKEVAPNLWIMPPGNLHMTTMEITHSRTESEIDAQVTLLASKLEKITDYTFLHRAKLVHPMISYDATAVALSFVPTSGADSVDPEKSYTYHHLRRDLHGLCQEAGVAVQSRYIVPSAHLTIGRFVTQHDFTDTMEAQASIDADKVKRWVARIEQINQWLRETLWSVDDKEANLQGEWTVGQEKGLDCCKGTLWYGNGTRVRLGKGF